MLLFQQESVFALFFHCLHRGFPPWSSSSVSGHEEAASRPHSLSLPHSWASRGLWLWEGQCQISACKGAGREAFKQLYEEMKCMCESAGDECHKVPSKPVLKDAQDVQHHKNFLDT